VPINATGYFNCLRSYLNTSGYEITTRDNGRIVLKEKVYWPGETKPKDHLVRLPFSGDVIVIRLDLKNQRGNPDPLFHFLDDESKPWAKRCDFVIFQLLNGGLNVYCIELKSASLPDSLVDQLDSSEAWCKALHSIIKLYTNKEREFNLRKFVFSCMEDPSAYLDADDYLRRDHTIRHFHYDELKELTLEELVNDNVEVIG